MSLWANRVDYGVDDEPATLGLVESLAATITYRSNGLSQSIPFNDTHIGWLIARTRDWFSLPTQRKMLHSATDYEFVRARRVIHVAFGVFQRAGRQLPIDQRDALQEHGRNAVIIFGRALLLPLIAIFRDPSVSEHIPTHSVSWPRDQTKVRSSLKCPNGFDR